MGLGWEYDDGHGLLGLGRGCLELETSCRYWPCTSGVLCSGGGGSNKHLKTGISDGQGEKEGGSPRVILFCSFSFLVSV
jgi:hypothetical protein